VVRDELPHFFRYLHAVYRLTDWLNEEAIVGFVINQHLGQLVIIVNDRHQISRCSSNASWRARLACAQLYAVEKKLREQKAGPQLRAAMREWQSRPVLARLHRAMELVRRRTSPQGSFCQAIDYALKRWDALTRFVEDGSLEIDNNLVNAASGITNIMPRLILCRATELESHFKAVSYG
jgi:hypothetical protein